MNTYQILEIPWSVYENSSGKAIYYPASSDTWLILQPWLGSSAQKSLMVNDLVTQFRDRCHMLCVDHPYHGLDGDQSNPENFTLDLAWQKSLDALRYFLKSYEIKKIILVWNSLGFWTLNLAARKFWNDLRCLALLGKSWVTSYKAILDRLIQHYGDLEKVLLDFFKIENGVWSLQTSKKAPPVKIYEKFVRQVPHISDENPANIPMYAWHASDDPWIPINIMREFVGNWNTVFERNGWHDLDPSVHDEMWHHIISKFFK